jgi:hypothetical protein
MIPTMERLLTTKHLKLRQRMVLRFPLIHLSYRGVSHTQMRGNVSLSHRHSLKTCGLCLNRITQMACTIRILVVSNFSTIKVGVIMWPFRTSSFTSWHGAGTSACDCSFRDASTTRTITFCRSIFAEHGWWKPCQLGSNRPLLRWSPGHF